MIEPDGKDHVCEMCGECCMNGSPTLHLSDFKLFEDNVLTMNDVYTLRNGELVYDNVGEEIDHLKNEMIKIKEAPGSKTCIFYEPESRNCGIYDKRPLQCVYFECWNPKKFFETMNEEKLKRDDLFYRLPAIKEIINAHEDKCSHKKISDLFKKVEDGDEAAADEILEILQYDTEIRPLISKNMNIPEESMDLILGRSLVSTMFTFGYKVEIDDKGNHFLTLDKPSKE